MLTRAQEERICLLLADPTLSRREIARMTGISRTTIIAIATGRRQCIAREEIDVNAETEESPPPARCPTCGGMVILPCRLCHVRLVRKEFAQPQLPELEVEDDPLRLDLRPAERQRYEEIRFQPLAPAISHQPGRPGRPIGSHA